MNQPISTRTLGGGSAGLIQKLEHRRDKEGLSNRQFALKLGVSRELWRLTRIGKRGIGITLARGIRQNYPDLERDLNRIFLANDNDTSVSPYDISHTPHNGILGRFSRFLAFHLTKLIFPGRFNPAQALKSKSVRKPK
jgi:hypothetical protein